MRYSEVYVPCCWCSGSGKLRHPRLSEALTAITSGLRTSAQVGRAIGVSPEGACNLLSRLRVMGLAKREKRKHGKGYLWSAT